MDHQTKLMFARLLAETYRLQRAAGVPCPINDATLFGLLEGIPEAIDDAFGRAEDAPTREQHEAMGAILQRIWSDPDALTAFKGFYDIEQELKDAGVSRTTAITLLRYFKANSQFAELIAKMDSSHSPGECRTFELNEWDKFPPRGTAARAQAGEEGR